MALFQEGRACRPHLRHDPQRHAAIVKQRFNGGGALAGRNRPSHGVDFRRVKGPQGAPLSAPGLGLFAWVG